MIALFELYLVNKKLVQAMILFTLRPVTRRRASHAIKNDIWENSNNPTLVTKFDEITLQAMVESSLAIIKNDIWGNTKTSDYRNRKNLDL